MYLVYNYLLVIGKRKFQQYEFVLHSQFKVFRISQLSSKTHFLLHKYCYGRIQPLSSQPLHTPSGFATKEIHSIDTQQRTDILWGQPIKLIQVASTSELCENQRNDLRNCSLSFLRGLRSTNIKKVIISLLFNIQNSLIITTSYFFGKFNFEHLNFKGT